MMRCAGWIAACWLVPVMAVADARCPQPRFTGSAPDAYLQLANPLAPTRADLRAGRRLYLGREGGQGCAICHGSKGDGEGPLAASFNPPPRNFTCQRTVRDIADGQLFWIIRHGSPGTSMPAYPALTDTQVWQLVLELRRLAR